MATKNPNKDALTKNRPEIVKKLANPDKVADYLFSIELFDMDMRQEVMQEKETEQKTRKILDTLHRRGPKAAKGLHDAFINCSNKELAELLAPYIKIIESEDNKFTPKAWPPSREDQNKMEADPVKRITDVNSPDYIGMYTHDEVYKMRNRIRGKVFIINNETFKKEANLRDRKGSDVDAKNLKNLFTQLQFEVVTAKDQSAKDMIGFLEKERDKVNWYDMECVVLIIMSHGETDGIYGTDGKLTKLKNMTDIFDSSEHHCPGLKEKPKLVFVQACRGTNTEADIQATDGADTKDEAVDVMKDMTVTDTGGEDTTDAVPDKVTKVTGKKDHSASDFLIAYATPEGTPAYRNIESGSWFLNAIVWTFKYHAHKQHIHDLLSMVNSIVSKGRTKKGNMTVSEVKYCLRKKFFFFPGVYDSPPQILD